MKSLVFFATVGLAAANVFERAICRNPASDSCNRALSATPVKAKADCTSYFKTYVPAQTKTITSGTSTILTTSTRTLSTTRTVTTTQTPTNKKTVTNTAFTTITLTNISTVFTTTTVSPPQKMKRTNAPGIPSYATACSTFSRYSSGCSCLGVTATTRTSTIIHPATTKTVVSSRSITKTSTSTKVIQAASSTTTVTSTSTITSTTVSITTQTSTIFATSSPTPTPSICNVFKLEGFYQPTETVPGHDSWAYTDSDSRLRFAATDNASLGDVWSFTTQGYLIGSDGNVLRRDPSGAIYETNDSRTPLACQISGDGAYTATIFCQADGQHAFDTVVEEGQVSPDAPYLYLGYTGTGTVVSEGPVPTFVAHPQC